MDLTTEDRYLSHLRQLLPQGTAWEDSPELVSVLSFVASRLSAIHNQAIALLDEADPRTTRQLLAEWESFAGLPDSCSRNRATTLQERRSTLWQRLTGRGGQSIAFFQKIAERLGYSVTILPHGRPFICGRSRCGQILGGSKLQNLHWRVTVHGPRITNFRTGASRCGESLGKISRAEDLECLFRRLMPAHTVLVFAYEGD
jgi:uncharacterized protein YmfQ (DUF2313 family)